MRASSRLLACLVLALAASRAAAQIGAPRTQQLPWGVGIGGEAVTDTGRASDVKAFSNHGFHAFGELVLEPGVVLQARYMSFALPGAPGLPGTSAPDVRVKAGLMSVGYLFREPWWDAGFVGGVGVYGFSPNAIEGDQTSQDVKETVIGWHAGLVTAFHVAAHWDVRLEVVGHLIRTDANHKPITAGGSVAYHF